MIHQTNNPLPFSVKIGRKMQRFQTREQAEAHLAVERSRLAKIAQRELTERELQNGIDRHPGARDEMRFKPVKEKPDLLMEQIDSFAKKRKDPIERANYARKDIYKKFKQSVIDRREAADETVDPTTTKQLNYAEKFFERALFDPTLPEHSQLLAQALIDNAGKPKWEELHTEASQIEKQLHLEAKARAAARRLEVESETIVEPIGFETPVAPVGTLAKDIANVIAGLPADDPRITAALSLQDRVQSGTVSDVSEYSAAKVAANLDQQET